MFINLKLDFAVDFQKFKKKYSFNSFDFSNKTKLTSVLLCKMCNNSHDKSPQNTISDNLRFYSERQTLFKNFGFGVVFLLLNWFFFLIDLLFFFWITPVFMLPNKVALISDQKGIYIRRAALVLRRRNFRFHSVP